MASGSSGRPSNSGSKGFDFASDDILCSYEDYGNHDPSNGSQSDPSIGANTCKTKPELHESLVASSDGYRPILGELERACQSLAPLSFVGWRAERPFQDFQKSRISRSSVFPTTNVYSQPEETLNQELSRDQELISTVERTMKKYADNLMRFLEGISSRLSQLELYCYNLDKSIGDMRSDLLRGHGEADSKLKSVEKHLQEVQRSVQILRDKQELAETQKELAKLQLVQKESSFASHDERPVVSASESKKTDDVSDAPNTQLALALPSQVAPQSSHLTMQQQSVTPPPQPPSQTFSQLPPFYLPSTRLPNPQSHSQPPYLPADAQYRSPQLAPQSSQPSQTQINQTPQAQQFPQYQQQWPQQVTQTVQPPQSQPIQPQNQIRAPAPPSGAYPPYMASQPANAAPSEVIASSMPMQLPFPGITQPGASRGEAMPYGYGGTGRPVQPQPSPNMKGGFPSQPGDGYATGGTYMLYDSEAARSHHPHQPSLYSQGGYPPPNPSLPTLLPPSSTGLTIRTPSPPQFVRNHPYNDLIDKLVSMGYRVDHVASVMQRLEESGQPVDFNAVLDRLNGHSSGASQRGW